MIFRLVQKDLTLFLRKPQQLMVILLMPFVLITILGNALGSLGESTQSSLKANVIIAQEGNEEAETKKFAEEIANMPVPAEQKKAIIQGTEKLNPIAILKHNVLGSDVVKSMITVKEMTVKEAKKERKNKENTAVIIVPQNFSYEVLQHMFLKKKETPTLQVTYNEKKENAVKLVQDILSSYQKQLTLQSNLSQAVAKVPQEEGKIFGAVKAVHQEKPLSAIAYYTIAMSMMFVMYVASTMASYSYMDKEQHVYDRIIISNLSPYVYFGSIFCSTALIAFLQLSILFGLAALIYHVYWASIGLFFIVTASISLAVAGLGVFLAVLNFISGSSSASAIFSSVVVSILALIGGSFVPTSQLPASLQNLSEFVPNGAGLMAYLQVVQGYSFSDIQTSVVVLLLYGLVFLMLSVFVFNRRKGEVAI
ncbi:ABC transporter permease [Priestia koreensis]|uniref:ABC transporter permease n=1 Tax=Priestia koreensis TaxID=284581 RepID=UPI003D01A59A